MKYDSKIFKSINLWEKIRKMLLFKYCIIDVPIRNKRIEEIIISNVFSFKYYRYDVHIVDTTKHIVYI